MKYNIKEIMGDRILIKQEREKKIGSILIAADSQEKSKTAEVLKVGDEVTKIHIGDKVLFDKFSESVLDEDESKGEIFSIITEGDVIAIIGA